jgi:Xaa-Pro aminopeptidase
MGPEFGHSLGHGIGLEVHEAPRLAKTADGVLPVGAVVTIEPGV